MRGVIFDVEEFSVYDGPGVRTSVFFKGCPLRCAWCHNPEGQRSEPEYMRSMALCGHCGACLEAGRRATGKPCLVRESVAACPEGLVRLCGEEVTPEEVFRRVMKNAEILRLGDGGVTFSGGEPLFQGRFLLSCLDAFSGALHRAVQTCGFGDAAVFSEMLGKCETVLFDLKLKDPSLHQRWTGRGNEVILESFRTLARSGRAFTVRTPLIPAVTDTRENLAGILDLLRENGVSYLELLPYNAMAGAKYAALGRPFSPGYDEGASLSFPADLFEEKNVRYRIL